MSATRKTQGKAVRRLIHRGKLHWASLMDLLPVDLVTAHQDGNSDPFSLGWQLNEPQTDIRLSIRGLIFATAEAAVALAALAETIRSPINPNAFRLSCRAGPQDWVRALGLDALAVPKSSDTDANWATPMGCSAYALRRFEIESRDAVIEHTSEFVAALQLLPDSILSDQRAELLLSVERVVYEVLLNIFEHAYDQNERKTVFLAATVTPSPLRYFDSEDDVDVNAISDQEREWLRENRDRLIFEVAIADAGHGIPARLSASALAKKRQFTKDWITNPLPAALRAAAHQALCEYSFHHDSTRKPDNEFTTLASRLTWRGLHRGLKQVENLSGSIVLASGQGRAGYVFVDNRMTAVVPSRVRHVEFPGTLAVLRFAVPAHRVRRSGSERLGAPLRLRIGYLASDDHLKSDLPHEEITKAFSRHESTAKATFSDARVSEALARFAKDGKKVLLSYFPFTTFTNVRELIALLPSLTPNVVPAILFAHIPPHIRTELRAYGDSEWSSLTHGSPRLLCVWTQDRQTLTWQIGGEVPVPHAGQKLYTDLERTGHAELANESDDTIALGKDLARTYPDFLVWDEKNICLSFVNHEASLAPEDFAELLTLAVRRYLETEAADSIVFSVGPNEAIQIPTGRLVGRFLSVFQLLRSSPVLVSALRQRLLHVLEDFGPISELCLVADGPASFFAASILLRDAIEMPHVDIYQRGAVRPRPNRSILFVDAIFRGDTIKRIAAQLEKEDGWSRHVIACLDLRNLTIARPLDIPVTITSLAKYRLDTQERPIGFQPERVYEVDAITHVPSGSSCEFLGLGTSSDRQEFLEAHRELFKAGFHRISAGQTHTVSFRTSELVTSHSEVVVNSCAEEVVNFVGDLPRAGKKIDLVFFSRPQSRVHQLIQRLAVEVRRRLGGIRATFRADVIVAPMTPKAIFPRDENNVMSELRSAESQEELFSARQLGERFVGIYLDDAAITGRSLQDFMVKAAGLDNPRAQALLCLVLVNRLSPRETRFLEVCQDLGSHPASGRQRRTKDPLPFRYRSLFRLQVKMADEREIGGIPSLLDKLRQQSLYFDDRLKVYMVAVAKRVGANFGELASPDNPPVLHPLFPHTTEQSSLSVGAIWLRHLLALNLQNEGVISPILSRVDALVSHDDTGLLSILALEPGLLNDDPIPTVCWSLIRKQIDKVLSSAISSPIKSDALLLLCHHPDELIKDLHFVLSCISDNDDLVDQLTAFLLEIAQTDRPRRVALKEAIESLIGASLARTVDRLRLLLDVPERIEVAFVIDQERDAIARIRKLLASTWTHTGALEDWLAFDRKVKQIADGEALLTAPDSELGLKCMIYAESILLSGLAGMRFLASKRRSTHEANQIWEALIEGIRRVSELRRIIRTSSTSFDASWREAFNTAWIHLRRATLKGVSPIRLLGRSEGVGTAPSTIESMLPHLYSAPVPLLQELAQKYAPLLKLTFDNATFTEKAVIVPIPKQLLVDSFRIVLENIAKYGRADTQRARCILIQEPKDHVSKLVFEFADVRRPDVTGGEGTGIPLLKAFAQKGQFAYSYGNGDPFTTTLSFSNVMEVVPEI